MQEFLGRAPAHFLNEPLAIIYRKSGFSCVVTSYAKETGLLSLCNSSF
jgi:hypothetical protein